MKKACFFSIALILLLCTPGLAQYANFTVSPSSSESGEDVFLDIDTGSDSPTITQAELYAWYEDEDGNNYGEDEFYTGGGKAQLTLSIHWDLWYNNPDIHVVALHYEYYVLYSDNTVETKRYSFQITQ